MPAEERRAAELLKQLLGGEYKPRDTDGAQGMHDFDLRLDDGRTFAVEVTTDTSRVDRAFQDQINRIRCRGGAPRWCGSARSDSRWLEEHPEFDGRLTRRLAQRLVADAEVMTIRAVVRRHGVSWPSVNALVRAWSGLIAEHRRSRRCRVLLVDETSMRKRHRYVTVIVNGDTGRTLAMVEHRSSAALSAFLMSQPHKCRD